MDEQQRKWSFEEWSKTYDAILTMYEKAKTLNDKIKFSAMLVNHCYKNYNFKWSRGM